jgi:hypothetical protein
MSPYEYVAHIHIFMSRHFFVDFKNQTGESTGYSELTKRVSEGGTCESQFLYSFDDPADSRMQGITSPRPFAEPSTLDKGLWMSLPL